MGKGVPRDYVISYMWFERSASQLTGSDQDSVIEMRDSVGRKLSADQIAKARRLAKKIQVAIEGIAVAASVQSILKCHFFVSYFWLHWRLATWLC